MSEEVDEREVSQLNDIEEMPEPETRDYVQYCFLKPKFFEMLHSSIGTLPYAKTIGDVDRNYKVNELFNAVNVNNGKLTIEQMNEVLSALSLAPYNLIRPLMQLLETPEGQQQLWDLKEE